MLACQLITVTSQALCLHNVIQNIISSITNGIYLLYLVDKAGINDDNKAEKINYIFT